MRPWVRFRRIGFQIASVSVGLFIGLTAAEMAARLLSPAAPPSGCLRQLCSGRPSSLQAKTFDPDDSRTEEFDYDYRHNTYGFRDVEHVIAKGEGTFRILGLGDSFTYGIGVALEETYLYRLEAMLNNRAGIHPRVEIIKAGIPRYVPQPERILLEMYGLQFRPDLVLVGFLPNDVIDTSQGLDAAKVDRSGYLMTREAKELGHSGMQIYRHSAFGRLLLKRYVEWQIQRKYPSREGELFRSGGFHEGDWVKLESEYDRMAESARSIGARLAIVHIPQKGPWMEESRYPATRLSAWAARRDVDFTDLLPAMARMSTRKRLYYEKDGHCTSAGHAAIAHELYAHLTDRNLIP